MKYIYIWGNNPIRKKYKNQICEVLAYGNKNSIMIKFENGDIIITSRFAIRKLTDEETKAEKMLDYFFE